MKNKKLIALLLTAMMALTACGSEEVNNNTRERVREERTENTEVTGSEEEEPEEEEPEAKTDESKPQKIKILTEGDTAPDFTAELCDGGSFTLSEHSDEVVLINFWATWCGPCVREMPAFEKLKADGIEGFDLVCINCMDDKETVDSFVKTEGYTFNIAYDVDGSIEQYYPTDGIPYTLIVDHGVISKIYVGAMDAEFQYNEYKSAIEEIMK